MPYFTKQYRKEISAGIPSSLVSSCKACELRCPGNLESAIAESVPSWHQGYLLGSLLHHLAVNIAKQAP